MEIYCQEMGVILSLTAGLKPMSDFSCLIIAVKKAFPGRLHRVKLPYPYQTWCTASARQFLKRVAVRLGPCWLAVPLSIVAFLARCPHLESPYGENDPFPQYLVLFHSYPPFLPSPHSGSGSININLLGTPLTVRWPPSLHWSTWPSNRGRVCSMEWWTGSCLYNHSKWLEASPLIPFWFVVDLIAYFDI